MLVQCEDCSHHFVLSPGDISGATACPDCGGKRFFRDQPSPTQSDGTLRDMVDSDTQKDQGGNPLGEGTIMGDHPEQPAWRRDNFMHSHVLAALVESDYETPEQRERAEYLNEDPTEPGWVPHDPRHPIQGIPCPRCGQPMESDPRDIGPHCRDCEPQYNRDPIPETAEGFRHPDQWMDSESGSLVIPEHWSHNILAALFDDFEREDRPFRDREREEREEADAHARSRNEAWRAVDEAGGHFEQSAREEAEEADRRKQMFPENDPHTTCPECGHPVLPTHHNDWSLLDCPQCHLRYDPKEWQDVTQGFEGTNTIEHPDPWMDNEPGTLTIPKGHPALWTHVVESGHWEDQPGGEQQFRKTDPADNLRCPNCHEQVAISHEPVVPGETPSGAAHCLHCNHSWPIHRDEGYVPQYIMPDNKQWSRYPIDMIDPELENVDLGPIHQGSTNDVLAALVDPMNHIGCPACGGDILADPEYGDLFCTKCTRSWPVHKDMSAQHAYEPQGILETEGLREDHSLMGPVHQGAYYPDEGDHDLGAPATCPQCRQTTVEPTTGQCQNCGYTIPWDGGEWFDMPGADRLLDKAYREQGDGYHWKNPEYVSPQLGPAHQGASEMDDIVGVTPEPQPSTMQWTPGMHGRGLMIAGEPHTWNAYDPKTVFETNDTGIHHAQYVEQAGIPSHLVDWHSGVEIRPTGEVERLFSRDPRPFIEADPRLKSVEGNSISDPFAFQSAMSSSNHERTNNMEPYDSWMHEADVAFEKGPDANVPQHSIVVQPSEVGLHMAHGGHRGPLAFLDAHVNGIPVRGNGGELIQRYGLKSSPEFGKPVIVAVHDPSHLPAAVQVVQNPMGKSPLLVELAEKIRNGEAAPPPGIDPGDIAPSARGLSGSEQYQDTENPHAEQEEEVRARQGTTKQAGPALLALGIGGEGGLGAAAGGLMGRALTGLGVSQIAKGAENALGMGGEGQQGQQEPAYQSPLNPLNASVLAALVESRGGEYETPASNPDVGVKHDDPEDVDQHEFNDQDKSPENPLNPNLEDSGKSGEDQVRDEQGFGPQSRGLERMQLLMPLIEHYYHSPESGAQDPMIKGLHEMLEAENPGYLDRADPQIAEQFIQQKKKPEHVHANVKESIVPPMQQPGLAVQQALLDPSGGNQVQQPLAQTPPGGGMQQGHCPNCGGVTTADGSCPQCGAKTNGAGAAAPAGQVPGGPSMPPPMMQSFTHLDLVASLVDSANHQGPVTPEQIAAVQQWLIENGRVDEVPNVPLDPGNPEYAKILAEIQQNPIVPPTVTPEEQTQPPPPQPAPGAMPMPGMGGEPGGQPMQPMASHEAGPVTDALVGVGVGAGIPLAVGLGSPVNDLGESGAEVLRQKTRGVLGKCPYCGGAKVDGEHCEGPGCRNNRSFYVSQKTAADNVATRCPVCNSGTTGMVGDEDHHARCHACGNIWKMQTMFDDSGAAGNTSIARTADDHVQDANPVNAPAAEQQQPLNQGGDEDSSLTWQDTEGNPIQANQEYTMKNPAYAVPDVVRVDRVKPDGLDVTMIGMYPNSLQSSVPISKQDMEMQELTFEPLAQDADGRNNEPPPGSQTPGDNTVPPSGQTTDERANSELPTPQSSVQDDACPHCGHNEHTSAMINPEATEHNCFRCGHDWVTEDQDGRQVEAGIDLSWLKEDDGAEDFLAHRREGMAAAQSRSIGSIHDSRREEIRERLAQNKQERMQREGGKHFTPREQRELIDEDGMARNSDMLNLEGTHYKHSHEADQVNSENVPDEHLFMGV